MRYRVSSSYQDLGAVGIVIDDRYPHIPAWSNVTRQSFGSEGQTIKSYESEMTDFEAFRPKVRIGRDGKWERVRYTRKAPYNVDSGTCNLKPIHPCTHEKTELIWKDVVPMIASVTTGVGGFDERTITNTATFSAGSRLYSHYSGVSSDNFFGQDLSSISADEFRKPDWFALMSRFDEMCEQFVPSSFLAGEDLLQGSIFIDALKLMINPTNGIKFILNWAARLPGRKAREINLGQFAKHVAKESSNQYLAYQFGVKPAIDSVRKAILAHLKVSKRLSYLAQLRGNWVPVRVRSELYSNIVNATLGQSDPVEPLRFQWQHRSRINTACLGAWGRVREDLNSGEAWKAYLQYFGVNKVAGLAWELIPFSFVVDWFTNAQERINLVRIPIGEGPFTEFARFCASEKKEDVEELYCIPGFVPSLGMAIESPTDPFIIAERRRILYSRYPRIPDVSGVVDLSTLGLFHYGTAASLIVQRLFR